MKKVLMICTASVLLAGCETNWVNQQHDRCRAMGGHGSYAEKLFECWEISKPGSLKIEFNKAVDFKKSPRVKLYELRYQ